MCKIMIKFIILKLATKNKYFISEKYNKYKKNNKFIADNL